MNQPLTVGIIGDFDSQRRSHIATNDALSHAATALSVRAMTHAEFILSVAEDNRTREPH